MAVLVLKLLLVLTNFAILTYLLLLVIQHYYANYNMKSWASIFNLLSLTWLLIRGSFWVSTLTTGMRWTALSFYLLYWMPTPLEFGAFMVQPLYFAQILYPREWNEYWRYIRPAYFGLITGIVLFQGMWSWLAAVPKEVECIDQTDDYDQARCYRTEYSTNAFRIISGVCFLFLAIIQYRFGAEVLNIDGLRYNQFLGTPRNTMAIVNAVLVFSFASRSLYQLLAVFKLYILPDVPIQGDGDVAVSIFLIFECWIYVPTVLITTYITARPLGNRNYLLRPDTPTNVAIEPFQADYGSIYGGNVEEEERADGLWEVVPSRQNSLAEISESIPILSRKEPSELRLSVPSSLNNRTNTWLLSEADPQRNTPPDQSHQPLEKGTSLLSYFRKRARGGSLSSETSSLEAGSYSASHQHAGSLSLVGMGADCRPLSYRRHQSLHNYNHYISHSPGGTASRVREERKDYFLGTVSEDERLYFQRLVPTDGSSVSESKIKEYEFQVEPPSPTLTREQRSSGERLSSSNLHQPPVIVGSYQSGYVMMPQHTSYPLTATSYRGQQLSTSHVDTPAYEHTGGDHVHDYHSLDMNQRQVPFHFPPPSTVNNPQEAPVSNSSNGYHQLYDGVVMPASSSLPGSHASPPVLHHVHHAHQSYRSQHSNTQSNNSSNGSLFDTAAIVDNRTANCPVSSSGSRMSGTQHPQFQGHGSPVSVQPIYPRPQRQPVNMNNFFLSRSMTSDNSESAACAMAPVVPNPLSPSHKVGSLENPHEDWLRESAVLRQAFQHKEQSKFSPGMMLSQPSSLPTARSFADAKREV